MGARERARTNRRWKRRRRKRGRRRKKWRRNRGKREEVKVEGEEVV